jgi:hypothetical protein
VSLHMRVINAPFCNTIEAKLNQKPTIAILFDYSFILYFLKYPISLNKSAIAYFCISFFFLTTIVM